MFKVSPLELKEIINVVNGFSDVVKLGDLGVAKNIIQQIRADLDNGLNENDMQERRNHFGSNKKPDQVTMSIGQAFRRAFFKFSWLFCEILSGCAFLLNCAATNWQYSNQWIESIVISTLIWSNLIISIFQLRNNDKLEKAKLQMKEQQKQVTVLRNGEKKQIIAGELVVGDVVILKEGMTLYADGIVIEAEDLFLSEGAITGESDQIKKTQIDLQQTQPLNFKENIVLGLSTVITGYGKYVVLTVGPNTIFNMIQELIQDDDGNQEGFLQSQAIELQQKLSKFGFLGSVLVIFLMIGRYIITYNEVNAFTTFSNILNLIIVLFSANTSEALTIHYTIQFSQTVSNIIRSNNLVRNFKCLEQLAFMNKLVVDKTGVLTENRMALESFWNENSCELNQLEFNQFPKDFQKALFQCCYVNNQIYLKLESHSPIEKEIYKICSEFGVMNEDKVTTFIPLNSRRKQITTILNNNRIVVRGACEIVLNSCSHFHSLSEGIVEIDQTKKEYLIKQIEHQGTQGRLIAIAYRDIDMSQIDLQQMIDEDQFDLNKSNLTLVGFLLFNDPVRKPTQQAVAQLQTAGIKVIMATGDNSMTSKSVAIKSKIFDSQSKIIEGADFTRLCRDQNQEFSPEFEQISVVSRACPEDKYNLVKQLQKNGNVVGYCGDGTNDAPAIHGSDIGFAFGISGTEIARASSDIIILDDNVASIVSAVMFGRNLLDSVKKFTQYIISCHLPLIIILIAQSAVGDQVISPLQLIWISLITNLFATFALSNPTPGNILLQRKPHRFNEKLLDKLQQVHIGILSTYQIIVGLIFLKNSLMVFNTFVLVTLFNLINSRMITFEINVFKGFCSSLMIFTSLIGISLLQFIIIQFGGSIMSTYDGLTLEEWGISIGFGIGSLIWRMLMVLIIRLTLVICKIINLNKNQKLKVE